jgi:pimeloyl-ACP methyl ester carboxylesterase
MILPASIIFSKSEAAKVRSQILLCGDWKYKRITIETDGYAIDGMIVGKPSTLTNGKWVLYANGNGELYEYKQNHTILEATESNGLFFNYPGVGASTGSVSRQSMAKALQAALAFLEDEQRGVGAKEVVVYGWSIGGGVQGDLLKIHAPKKTIKYVFIKDRTFSNLSTEVSELFAKPLGIFIRLFNWNIDSVESSKKLQYPEIIIQTAKVREYTRLFHSSEIIDDGIILAKASLAKALLDDPQCPKENKLFIGIPERHNIPLQDQDIEYLAEEIKTMFQQPAEQEIKKNYKCREQTVLK